jgi:two-component system alkaline phosphatase synthesis response regulator PhoP
MADRSKVLVVEDDKNLARLVAFNLEQAGHEAVIAFGGESAVELVRREKPDLIVLDIMLPGIDGWDVCRIVREDAETSGIPIIMLTAKAEMNDRIRGFQLGVDDYITKPFSPRELMARVKRVLARSRLCRTLARTYVVGDLRIEVETLSVTVADKEVILTPKERMILRSLISRPGEVVTRDQILDEAWDNCEPVEFANIDVHIHHMREKIEKDPSDPQVITTVKGVGYRIELEVANGTGGVPGKEASRHS